MTSRSGPRLAVIFALLWFTTAASVQAQLTDVARPSLTPQAKSQQELDLYLDIVTTAEPKEAVRLVETFAQEFPRSELLGSAYQSQMHAYEQLDDFAGMLAAGRQSLRGNPDNFNTLLSLSSAIANRAGTGPGQNQLLSEAKGDAEQVLAELDRVRIPLKLSLEKWHLEKKQMQSQAHGVLGTIALRRGDSKEALSELETALTLAPSPEGVQFLRLGLAEISAGRKVEAEANLQHAAELGPDPVRSLASGELNKLRRPTPGLP